MTHNRSNSRHEISLIVSAFAGRARDGQAVARDSFTRWAQPRGTCFGGWAAAQDARHITNPAA